MHYKIGYWPYGAGLDKAGDRRRFVFYAKEKNIPFEIASPEKEYDLVYLTMGCNISEWLAYKKKFPSVKIVYEIIDSYFFQKPGIIKRSMGLVRFVIGKESRLYVDYISAIKQMLTIADAVVCSSESQRKFILAYNKNTHVSLDYFENEITDRKHSYKSAGKLKLVWEGQAYTVQNLLKLKEVFRRLADKVELHVVTDPAIIYPFKVFNKKTSGVLAKLPCDVYYYPWEKETFSKHIASCDLAIIPIDQEDGLHWNKPENKLLLLWQVGIPVLTSNTPAYKKVMDNAGIPFLCNNPESWVQAIEKYIEMPEEERQLFAGKASKYLAEKHTKETIVQKWHSIFSSFIKNWQ